MKVYQLVAVAFLASVPARAQQAQLPPTTLLDVKISLADAQKNIEALNSVAAIACREHADCLSSGAQFGPIITAPCGTVDSTRKFAHRLPKRVARRRSPSMTGRPLMAEPRS